MCCNSNSLWRKMDKTITLSSNERQPIMKKTILKVVVIVSIMILSIDVTISQSLISVGHGNNWSQYTNLDSAIVHSVNGDYVYIPGGIFNLTKVINKKLRIFGVGHYPDSTTATNETKINSNIKFASGADSGSISGVHLTGGIYFGTSISNQVLHTYSILRCKIDGSIVLSFDGATSTLSNGFYISENVIVGNIAGGDAYTVLMEKNILNSYISNFQNGGVFRNNIFLFSYTECGSPGMCYSVFGYDHCDKIVNCLFENNIIFDLYPLRCFYYTNISLINCIFNNNLFIDNQYFPYQTNMGLNNIVNQSQGTIFENQTGNAFSYSHNYHLKGTCPGHNAGTDGTDVGIYGTNLPYKEGAVPANPHIRQKTISTNNNVINVNIKVAAQER